MLTRRLVIQSGLATIAAPAILRAQTLSGSVTLMTYTGIFQDNYTKAVVEPFLKVHPDVKVNFVSA
nr:ABC transporter substrate-binding protein [Bosea sp. (in: a-proteobacteria)]